MKPKLDAVTGITVGILLLVAVIFCAVIFGPSGPTGFTADQKTMVITATVAALGTIGGYWLNSSADAAKKTELPPAPSTVTTTVTQGEPEKKDAT